MHLKVRIICLSVWPTDRTPVLAMCGVIEWRRCLLQHHLAQMGVGCNAQGDVCMQQISLNTGMHRRDLCMKEHESPLICLLHAAVFRLDTYGALL